MRSVEFRPGYLSHLKITFTSGAAREFDIDRISKRAAKGVAAALGAKSI